MPFNATQTTVQTFGNSSSLIKKTKAGKGSPRRADDLLYGPEDWTGDEDQNFIGKDSVMFPELLIHNDSLAEGEGAGEGEKDFEDDEDDDDDDNISKEYDFESDVQVAKESYHYRRLRKALQQKPDFKSIVDSAIEECGLLKRYGVNNFLMNPFV